VVHESLKGTSTGPVRWEVERGAIRRFAAAIGDVEPSHARGDVAPPTFPTTLRLDLPAGVIEKSRILHAGEEYRYRRALRAGDVLLVERQVEDVYEKTGSLGRMTFIVLAGTGRDEQGEIVFESRTTLIYR
jgi:hydroxyacyl-ACP dehydratase HTD2-like protein with hotdog domain